MLSTVTKDLTSKLSKILFLILAISLFTFNFNATDALAAQATLSWTAPTNYAGGATIKDFVGYNLYMGTASGNYTKKVNIGDLTTYTVTNLTAGTTYYFALTAYDSMGNESGYSSEVNSGSTSSNSTTSTIYTISASAGTGGTISPAGSVALSKGTSQTFTITPATGYKVAGVTVDGASVGAVSSYTFSSVTANHTISATFSASTTSYTISATAGTGGSITPAGTSTVASGTSKAFTIAAASGYKVAGVTVDGASVGAVSSYTFSNVTANHTISATFSASTTSYTISATAGTGGSITPAGTTTLAAGASQAYTIAAASGYKIAGVTIDGASVGAVSSYTFSTIGANHTISATFSAAVSANIAHTGWSLKYVDSQELVGQNGAATNAFDGNSGTIWHTKWANVSPVPPCPHEIQINLGKSFTLTGFSYLPRQDGGINGTIAKYEFYVSTDGINWGTAVATGTWANNTTLKSVSFAAKTGQYIRLRALSEVNGGPWTSAAEINVTGY